ncbi:MAG: replication initiator protein [Arizlama microvirus]|nr:MAG: replication initiator protein [Arizlama microvirus]
MPCYSPLTAYYSRFLNPTGKRSLVFNVRLAIDDKKVPLPCGQCIGCRLERSRQWAIRCVHEASLYERNSFITLTYDDKYLPKDKSLKKEHFQRFMKRLRKRFGPNIRYFACGEYGEKKDRPHYHACLFNLDFRDKELFKVINGNPVYKSKELSKVWRYGFSSIGSLTFESAAYVARYITKKISTTGKNALLGLLHYDTIDPNTGEILQERLPEFTLMSRRPGVGKPWLDKYMSDIYPDDFVVLRNKKLRPPKYYDSLLARTQPFDHDDIKERRVQNAIKHQENNTAQRLYVREQLQLEKFKQLIRTYENET